MSLNQLFVMFSYQSYEIFKVFEQLAAMMLADRRKAAEEADETADLCERSVDSALDVRKILLRPDAKPPKKGCCGYFASPDTKAHVV